MFLVEADLGLAEAADLGMVAATVTAMQVNFFADSVALN